MWWPTFREPATPLVHALPAHPANAAKPMASSMSGKACAPCASRPVVGLGRVACIRRGCGTARRSDTAARQFVSGAPSLRPTPSHGAGSTVLQSNYVELAQLAEVETGLIFKVAGICFGITLVGLAIGFVLLRIEGLVEEKKIKL